MNSLRVIEPESMRQRARSLAPEGDTGVAILLILMVLLAGSPSSVASEASPEPVGLKSETAAAFDEYVRWTEVRNTDELQRGTGILWIDHLNDMEQKQAYEALRRGEIRMQRLETRRNGDKIRCPGGMIHHWAGVVFISGAKLTDVLRVLRDYNQHARFYAPDVERSRIDLQDGDHFRVFLRFRRHKVITVVLNTEHDIHYFQDSETRAHSRSSAVRIAEVENAGKSNEREKSPGDDGGFLWRMETWWRMEEHDGGVYLQSEVVSLTRDIPTGLGWLIGPFVTSIPKETLSFTLEATRRFVERTREQ